MSEAMRPISMFAIFVWSETVFGRLIERITGGPSHCAIGFTVADGTAFYFESLFEDGFRGPKRFLKLVQWVQADPRRKMAWVELPLLREVCERKWTLCETWVGHKGYAAWQIVGMWFFERIGKFCGLHLPDGPRHLDCSEALARIIQPDIDCQRANGRGWDEQTPGSVLQALALLGFAPSADFWTVRLVE